MSSIIKVDTIQDQDGNNIINENSNTITIGASGDTITIPSGATITNNGTANGFGATGAASWTTTVKTGNFTAVAGEGYFVDTTSGSITVSLPAGTAGAVVAIKDYANTFDTNKVILSANGSDKIGGSTDNKQIGTEGIAVTLIFIDSTKGWLVTDDGLQSSVAALTYDADFLCIAGGGGGGRAAGGGGGAGGYRNSFGSEASGGGGSSETALVLSPGTQYTITVGTGGAGSPTGTQANATDGNDSSISGSGITTITSVGGGGGGHSGSPGTAGSAGGSGGGGGAYFGAGGAGTANQGFAGGASTTGSAGQQGAGGGGGASAVGGPGNSSEAGDGGAGLSSSITGSSVARGGGGGGKGYDNLPGGSGGTGGGGAGGAANSNAPGTAGTANTGGGGGGSHDVAGASGGSGVVILSVPDANYSGTTTGSPTVATGVSGKTVITFTGNGSYTA